MPNIDLRTTNSDAQSERAPGRGRLRALAVSLTASAILAAAILGIIVLYFGSIQKTVAACQGLSLVVDADSKMVNTVNAADRTAVSFRLENISGEPVSIIGVRISCDCVTNEQTPLEIGPGESRPIRFEIHLDKKEATFRRSILLFTNVGSQPEIPLEIVGSPARGS